MRRMTATLIFALGAWFCPLGNARAATTVQVLATSPSGDVITLGRNQNFYLHLHYDTDQPASIWAQPYFEGKPVNAGSNPSRRYTGSGDALGWFFFMQPGEQVDEIRINAGNGSSAGTPWSRPIACKSSVANKRPRCIPILIG